MYASFVMRIVSELKKLNKLDDAANELMKGILKTFSAAGIALLRYALENAGAAHPILKLFADNTAQISMETGLENVVDALLKRGEANDYYTHTGRGQNLRPLLTGGRKAVIIPIFLF